MLMDDTTLGLFKKQYNEAKENKEDVFIFLDQKVYTTYAKYLIEYNENFRKENKK